MELKDCFIGMIVIENEGRGKIGWIKELTMNEYYEIILIVRFPSKFIYEEENTKEIHEDVFIYPAHINPL